MSTPSAPVPKGPSRVATGAPDPEAREATVQDIRTRYPNITRYSIHLNTFALLNSGQSWLSGSTRGGAFARLPYHPRIQATMYDSAEMFTSAARSSPTGRVSLEQNVRIATVQIQHETKIFSQASRDPSSTPEQRRAYGLGAAFTAVAGFAMRFSYHYMVAEQREKGALPMVEETVGNTSKAKRPT